MSEATLLCEPHRKAARFLAFAKNEYSTIVLLMCERFVNKWNVCSTAGMGRSRTHIIYASGSAGVSLFAVGLILLSAISRAEARRLLGVDAAADRDDCVEIVEIRGLCR